MKRANSFRTLGMLSVLVFAIPLRLSAEQNSSGNQETVPTSIANKTITPTSFEGVDVSPPPKDYEGWWKSPAISFDVEVSSMTYVNTWVPVTVKITNLTDRKIFLNNYSFRPGFDESIGEFKSNEEFDTIEPHATREKTLFEVKLSKAQYILVSFHIGGGFSADSWVTLVDDAKGFDVFDPKVREVEDYHPDGGLDE